MKDEKITFNSSKAKEYFLEKISFEMSPWKLKELSKEKIEDINIVDVRTYDDYIDGHIPFAIHIPLDNIEDHLVMLEKDKINIVYSYCPCCQRASKAAYMMAHKGFPVVSLCGGFKAWSELGFDIVTTSDK